MVDFKMQVVIIVTRVYQTNIYGSLKNLQFRMVWIDRLHLHKNRKHYIISKNCVMFSRRKNWTPTIMLLKNE